MQIENDKHASNHMSDALNYLYNQLCFNDLKYITDWNGKRQIVYFKTDTSVPCAHEWETIFLFSSTKENCKKCGCKKENI